jgi:hypothetical protein
MLDVAHAGKAPDAAALTSVTFLVDIDSESRHRRYLKYPYGFGADVLKYARFPIQAGLGVFIGANL